MNEVVYLKDVLPEICVFFGCAIVVLFIFLLREIKWRRKNPQAFTSQASEEEKKSCHRRTSAYFIFLYVWMFTVVTYVAIRSETARFTEVLIVGLICLGGIVAALSIRR